MVQWVECSLGKHEDLSVDAQHYAKARHNGRLMSLILALALGRYWGLGGGRDRLIPALSGQAV